MDDDYRNVKVICDDTDVFILLLYYYQNMNWQNDVFKKSFIYGKNQWQQQLDKQQAQSWKCNSQSWTL